MAKLIRSAIECAYKIGQVCIYPPKITACITVNEQLFPDNCPLETGVSIEDHLTHLNTMAQRHIDKENLMITIPKRNRKNCHWHLLVYDVYGRCTHPTRNESFCIGVKCGYFTVKTN